MSEDRRCPRTPGLVDRILAERVTDQDRAHAGTCASCGPVLARAQRFDDELRRTARGLVVEDLPRGVLDPRLTGVDRGGPGRGLLPSLGTGVLVVAIAIVAVAVVQRPLLPGGTASQPPLQIQTPTFLPSKPLGSEEPSSLLVVSSSITRRLVDLGFTCGAESPPPEPPRADAAREDVCTGPDEQPPNRATVIVGSASNGDVVAVTISADIGGADTPADRDTLATSLSQLAEFAFRSEAAATDTGTFVIEQLPGLEPGDRPVGLDVGAVHVELERLDSAVYVIRVALASPPA